MRRLVIRIVKRAHGRFAMLGCCSNITYIHYSVKTDRVDGYIKDTTKVSATTSFDCECLICKGAHSILFLLPQP